MCPPCPHLCRLPDMCHFAIVFMTCVLMVASLGCIVFGYRVHTVPNFAVSVDVFFTFLLRGDDQGTFDVSGFPLLPHHARPHARTRTHTHTHVRAHTHMRARTHTHTHTHTHTV